MAAILLAYLPVWHAGFIWDDDAHLTENPCIVGPLGFKGIWTTSAATYYPLVLTTFWIEHALWGLTPWPYHLVNVLMHAACAGLLGVVLTRLRVPGAWLGAAFWALHPVQVESVAWVTELKNTQSGLFYLLTVFFFLRWQGRRGPSTGGGAFALALGCAILAILSKSSTVMLPVVLGLCWWWRERRWRWRNLVALAPFFVISAAASGWTIWEQQFHSGALGEEWAQTLPQRLVLAGRVFWFYLGKLAWPHPLMFIYPRWEIDVAQPLAWLPLVAAVGMGLVFWATRNRGGRPGFLALGVYGVSLFPVLGFFSVYFFRYSFVGDHFQYLASMAPLALAGAGLARLSTLLPGRARGLTPALALGLMLTLGTLSWRQAWIYQSNETLWTDTITKNPACWLGYNNLGMDALTKGRKEIAARNLQRAIDLNPRYSDAFNNLGIVFFQMGRTDDAMTRWRQALRIAPGQASAHSNLALAFFQRGELDAAITHWQTALAIDPDHQSARDGLSIALAQRQPDGPRRGDPRRDLSIQKDAEAHYNAGMVLMKEGKVREAMAEWEWAMDLLPDNGSAPNQLAWVLATSLDPSVRDGARAVKLARRANELSGGKDANALDTLAAAYAEAGNFPEAIDTARRALKLETRGAGGPLAAALTERLHLYESRSPYRENGR